MSTYHRKELRTKIRTAGTNGNAESKFNALQTGHRYRTAALHDALRIRLLYRFKNLLSIVMSNVQQLGNQPKDSGPVIQETLARSREMQHFAELMTQLLKLKREPFQDGQRPDLAENLTTEDEVPSLHFRSLAESFSLKCDHQETNLTYKIPDNFPPLPSVSFYLQVLSYLLQDCMDRCRNTSHGAEMPSITLSCSYSKGHRKNLIEFQTEDSGRKISSLGQVLSQVGHAEDWSAELIIAKLFARYAGGGLSSKSSSDGTKIRIWLPVALPSLFVRHLSFTSEEASDNVWTEQPSQAATGALSLSSQNPRPIAKVLVVDDDTQMRDYLGLLLQNAGYEVLKAKNGMDALSMLNTPKEGPNRQTSPVKLLISDIMMPVMTGYELANELKKRPGLCDLPCIFITARTHQQDKLKALRMGINDYLTKPFDASELEARCRNLLHLSASRAREYENDTPDFQHTTSDEAVSTRFRKLVLDNITNSGMTLPEMAFELNLSERNLYRRVKRETGLTPNAFVREVRLLKARELLETTRPASLKQLGYDVGIPQSSYLKKLYILRFGKDPMKLLGEY